MAELREKILDFIKENLHKDIPSPKDKINYQNFWLDNFFEYDKGKQEINSIIKAQRLIKISNQHILMPYGIYDDYHELDFEAYSFSVLKSLDRKNKIVDEIIKTFDSLPDYDRAIFYHYLKKELRIAFYESFKDVKCALFDVDLYNSVAVVMIATMEKTSKMVTEILGRTPSLVNYDAVGFCATDEKAKEIMDTLSREIPFKLREKPWHRVVRFMNIVREEKKDGTYVDKPTTRQGLEDVKMAVTEKISQLKFKEAKEIIDKAECSADSRKRWNEALEKIKVCYAPA